MGPSRYRMGLLAAAMLGGIGTYVGGGSLRGRDAEPLRRNCGPMTDEQIRASAAQMKACKPQRPNRSRKSKAKKSKR